MKWSAGIPLEAAALSGLAALFVLLYFRPFVDLVGVWLRDPNFSHAFLIPPVIVFAVWRQRGRLAATPLRPAGAGLAIVGVSAAVLLVGTAGVEFFLMRTSAIGMVAGSIVYLAGWRWLRLLSFPLLLATLMIPIPPVIFYQLTFPLQLVATRFGVLVLELLRIPVLREGNIVWLSPHTALEVTEACSGIRSLLSLFTLALAYAHFSESRAVSRIVVTFASIPIAIISNGLRIAGTGIAAHFVGASAATGFFHTFSGWVVFATSVVLLLGLAALLRRCRLLTLAATPAAPPCP